MKQEDITIFGADSLYALGHPVRMLSHAQLLSELERLRDERKTTNADLSRLLCIPTSRVADIFSGKRSIKVDEAKTLVERFSLEPAPPAEPVAPSAEHLAPLLDALLPILPDGEPTEQSVSALSEALSYGLRLLGDRLSTDASPDELRMAARAAAFRFRDLGSA